MINKYKKDNSLEKRKQFAENLISKYVDKIPIIVEYDDTVIKLDKCKFLIPDTFSMGQLMIFIKSKVSLHSKEAIFIFINGNLMPASYLVRDVYDTHKDEDNFLYISINIENTFG